MKTPALAAAVLLAGCATMTAPASERSASLTQLEERNQKIAERAQQCKEEVEKRSKDEIAQITATPGASIKKRTEIAESERKNGLSRCQAEADRANDELSSTERSDYERRAEEERDRSALMMMFITSRPH